MNKSNASALIEGPRFCGCKLNPAGVLLAIPIGARGQILLLVGLAAFLFTGALAAAQTVGCAPNTANYPCVYVANELGGNVSVINAISNTVIATVPVGGLPQGLAVTPNNATVYVANSGDGTVSVISTVTNTVVTTVQMQNFPFQIAITPDGAYAYVTEFEGDPAPTHERRGAGAHVPRRSKPLVTGPALVEVIATATNTVVGSIANLNGPSAVAISPNGANAYVADYCLPNDRPCVEVVSTSSNQVVATVPISAVAFSEGSIAVTPDGSLVCVSVAVVNGEVEDLAVAFISTNSNMVLGILDTQTTSGISDVGFALTPGGLLYAAAFSPDGVYLVNPVAESLGLTEPIQAGTTPTGAALAPDGASVYVTNAGSDSGSVINIKTNIVTATLAALGYEPYGVAAMQVLPIPLINQPLVPDATPAGGSAFTLTVNGTLFTANSVVNWNGTPLATTFVSHDQLTAAVPASNIAAATTASITVSNPAPGGGTSNVVPFTVTSPTTSLTFASSIISVGTDPSNVVVADFNNDGKPDLAVVNQNQPDTTCYFYGGVGTISILLGNGDGTFSNTSTLCFPELGVNDVAGPELVAGDFNGDGKIDLVAALNSGGDQWYFATFLGNGDGTFAISSTFGGFNSIGTAIAGDFNGDGKLDLAFPATQTFSGIFVALGNGDGTFTCCSTYVNLSGTSLTTGDFNNDGILDLAVIGTGQQQPVTILLGNGDGTFTAAASQPSVVVTAPQSVTAGDFNGDGILDLAIADAGSGNLVVLLGVGDGTFNQVEGEPVSSQDSVYVTEGDFNGDNKLDLALANSCVTTCPPTITLFLGNGDGTFPAGLVQAVGNGPLAVGVADFNRDGRLDVAVANSVDNTVSILLQAPTATPSSTALNFSNQVVGTTSPSQQVSVTNNGSATLVISNISITGANSGDFMATPCVVPAQIPPGESCNVAIVFTPTATGTRNATLSITDNAAGSPQMVSLAGVGQPPVPAAMLNPSPLIFGSSSQPQQVGTSATTPVTLTNIGTGPLSITSIALAGQNASEFAQTNNCGSLLAPAAICTINVTFTPTANGGSGSATASLSVTDNAAGSPQTIPITGTVQNFALTTTCTSLTVVPGQTAIFTVDLAPVNGFAQSVSLSCSGAPALATCTVAPSSMTLDGSTTIQAKVTATTTQATSSLLSPFGRWNGNRMAGLVGLAGIAGIAALVVLPGKRRGKPARRLCGLIFLLFVLAIMAMLPACGGRGVDPPGTVAGTYPLTVTGTFQPVSETAITETVSFNLVVQ